MMNKYLLSALMLLLSSLSYAQPEDEIRPSINAKQFVSALSTVPSLYTGQLSINVPLFTLQGKGIDIPISLSFNTEGVTHETESSHIGLGWSLLAGGVITATIRDKDDNKTKKYNDIPWQYNDGYIQHLWEKENNNPYDINNFISDLNGIKGGDSKPDSYQYAFLDYSGSIHFSFRHSDQNIKSADLYPDDTFKLEQTTLGYKITADDGIEYLFEKQEINKTFAGGINNSYTVSWFLSEIKTPQGGYVSFEYQDESFSDLSYEINIGANTRYSTIKSKRLSKIVADYGIVHFYSAGRSDLPGAERIANIALHDNNGTLIKGYKLNNNSYFSNKNKDKNAIGFHSIRLKLDEIREYNSLGESLPPYIFEYDYSFERSKTSYKEHSSLNKSLNSWARNPAVTAVVDRDEHGSPACFLINYPSNGEEVGYVTMEDIFDITCDNYFCLSNVTFPSGGSESYSYGRHDYCYVSGSNEKFKTQSDNIMGKRLTKKTITDNNGNSYYTEYNYCLHDENYKPIIDNSLHSTTMSSGILIAPSIHTSVIYAPTKSYDRARLRAHPHITERPQNSFPGSPVCYTEVEEVFRAGNTNKVIGKKIYYFEKKASVLSQNYIYLDYDMNDYRKANTLIALDNKFYGTLRPYPKLLEARDNSYMTYSAYPVGDFTWDDTKGRPIKEVVLDSLERIVRKTENNYSPDHSHRLYGWEIRHCQDTIFKDTTSYEYIKNRYLINRTCYYNSLFRLESSTTTHYFPNLGASTVEKQAFSYASGRRIRSSTTTLNNGESLTTAYTYPDDISFNSTTYLSAQASSIKRMIDRNIIKAPVQVTQKKGKGYIGGTYTTYKSTNDGVVVTDSVFKLESKFETQIPAPQINNAGKVEKHNGFSIQEIYTAYDENKKPTSIKSRDNVTKTFKWGYKGQYVIAKFENYTNDQLTANTSLVSLLNSFDNYITNLTRRDLKNLLSCNQAIRSALPANAKVTTYTYKPSVGMTSVTDYKGVTTCYDYDDFGRLTHIYLIKDGKKEIIERYDYNYKE